MQELPPGYVPPHSLRSGTLGLVARVLRSAPAVYLLSNILLAAIPFALLPVLTRHLSPAEYGQVAMYQALLGGLGAFIGVGMAAAMARKHFDPDVTQESLRAFNGTCVQVLLLSAMLVAISVAFSQSTLSGMLSLHADWLLWGVVATTAGVLVQLRLAAWQVRHRVISYATFQMSQSVLNVALSVLLVVSLGLGALGRICAQSAAMLVFGAIAGALLWRDGLLDLRVWRPQFAREVLTYGIPLMPHVLAAFLLFSMDRVVINAELGVAEAGVYMVAVQLASSVSLVFDAVSRAYMPWLFARLQRDNPEEKLETVRSTYAWFTLILAAAGCVFLLGPRAVVLIAGSRYERAGAVIGWLVLGQAFLGMYLLLSSYVMYSKRTGLLSAVTVSSALLYLALLVILVPKFGMHGAASGFALAMGIRMALTWWAAHRSHPMPWLPLRSAR